MKNLLTGLVLLSSTLFASDIYATFNVEANKEAILAFTASGTIQKSLVDVGSVVKKGQLLASLQNSEQRVILELAKQDLANAKIQDQQSANSFNRYTKVKNMIEEEKYEKITFGAQISKINAKKAALNVRLRQAQLDKTILKAPFDGTITARAKQIGDSVTGMQVMPIFKIMDLSKVKLVIAFDEKYAHDVKLGDSFVYYVDGTKAQQNGKISKIYPTSDSKTRKITAEVLTQNLMPGVFGSGIIKAK